VVDGERPRLVFLGFGKYARSDRIYALEPLEANERGPGKRTLVWVEGIPQPIVASRSEQAILRDLGPGRLMVPSDLAQEALQLLRRLTEQLGSVGPLLRRQIRAEASLDLDELERRSRDILERTTRAVGSPEGEDALF
jgi:hypothetical protein